MTTSMLMLMMMMAGLYIFVQCTAQLREKAVDSKWADGQRGGNHDDDHDDDDDDGDGRAAHCCTM